MQDSYLLPMLISSKKNVLCFLLTTCFLLCNMVLTYAQSEVEVRQLNASMLPTDGRVNSGSGFNIDVSITYNTSESSLYTLILELPSNVEWSKDCKSDGTFKINKEEITLTGTTYTIPIKVMSQGSDGSNILLHGFTNLSEGNCDDNTTPISLSISPSVNIGETSKEILLITPKSGVVNPTFISSISQGHEKDEDDIDNGHFAYYVDVRLSGSGLTKLPMVSLAYNNLKLEFISSVFFDGGSSDPPFHDGNLGSLINDAGGSIAIQLDEPGAYNINSNRFIRFYFKTLGDFTLIPDDVVLSATGATYILCGETTEKPFSVADQKITDIILKKSVDNLYPSFKHKNNSFTICQNNCDFNLSTITSKFYFEIDNIVTDYGITTEPVVQIQCPEGVANILFLEAKSLQYTSGTMPDVTYITKNSTIPQNAMRSDSQYTFGDNNPTVIYIKGYANGGDEHAWDFSVGYSLKTINLSVLPNADKQFRLSYGDSFRNDKVYFSDPILISQQSSCIAGMKFEDSYELNTLDGFAGSAVVNYLPDVRRNMQIRIEPVNTKYSASYSISKLQYKLNSNMEFDVSNLEVLYSTTGTTGSWKPLQYTQSVGDFYHDVKIVQKADGHTLEISFIMDNSDPEKCGFGKSLYLMVPVHILNNAIFSSNRHRSTLSNNTLFTQTTIREWNVALDDFYKLNTSLSIICPGDRQEMNHFEKGQVFTIRYILNNENQNAVNSLNFTINSLAMALPEWNSVSLKGVNIRTKKSPVILNDKFEIVSFASEIRIANRYGKNDFELGGNDRLYIDVDYKLKDDLVVGDREDDIKFQLNTYTSGNDIERTGVPLTKFGYVEVVAQASCMPKPSCKNCVTSFSPLPGEEYLLSAWVKESYNAGKPHPASYKNAKIRVAFNDGDIDGLELFDAKGPIIDGWQRIERSFTVPEGAYNILVELVNDGKMEVYFDDIRIHPFRSHMKSFVYDPYTQRLVAELDENNYATHYEYDDEGILIRVKKETTRGVMTIKETRNNQSKIEATEQ
jgi:hypothetical protein